MTAPPLRLAPDPAGLGGAEQPLDEVDRSIVVATQGGLPLVPEPYETLAAQVGIPAEEVLARLRAMLERGVIRRIGAVPNHYAIGYTANGMSVWDVVDPAADAVGERFGALDFVTHCYRRPRRPPGWTYNLFAMVHDRSRERVMERIGEMARLLEQDFPGVCRARDVLFSSAILKKTGLRIGG